MFCMCAYYVQPVVTIYCTIATAILKGLVYSFELSAGVSHARFSPSRLLS